MKKLIEASLVPLLKGTIFFALYSFGGHWLLEKILWPAIIFLPEPIFSAIQPILKLDFGRLFGRVFRLFWALGFYLFTVKILFKESKTVWTISTHKTYNFIRGAGFGALLIIVMITMLFFSKKVTLVAAHLDFQTFFSTLLVYIVCMGCTAISEELVLRGYVLNTLMQKWGTHAGVWISSILFGLIHLYFSPLYAYTAFVAGLILGYGFVWHGIYYCIGWHFAWNLIEALAFSGKLFEFQVTDAFLAGQRSLSPDQEGILIIPILLFGVSLLFLTHKSKWTLKSKVDCVE